MRRLDQRGVAAVTIVIIIAVSSGAAVAAPVVADAAKVAPDSPFYGLRRLGEKIRMASDEDQMKERWSDYVKMVNSGKGLEYQQILKEFRDKMQQVAPEDTGAKPEVVQWMQGQMPSIGEMRLKLYKEWVEKLKGKLPENVKEILENELAEIEEIKGEIAAMSENVEARLQLLMAKLENIAAQYREPISTYGDIDNILRDVNVKVNIEIYIRDNINLKFNAKLEEFNSQLAEVQAMLGGVPENILGGHAAERLVEVAIKLENKALAAYNEGKVRMALGLIIAAEMNLRSAKLILEHASEWAPKFKAEWLEYKADWENLKQKYIQEGTWQSILENYHQYAENIKQRWQERLLGR